MLSIFSDESSYRIVDVNPLEKMQKDSRELLTRWNQKGYFYNEGVWHKYQ